MRGLVLVGAVSYAGIVAACGGDDPEATPADTPAEIDGGDADAAIVTDAAPSDGARTDASEDDAGDPDAGVAALEPGELLPGGGTTTSNVGVGAFTARAANLRLERRGEFEAGLQFFQLTWVVAPGRADIDGLGPTFNATSCPECHVRNGRGDVGTILVRIGLGPNNVPEPTYGRQLQPLGIGGVPGEGTPIRTELDEAHLLADGTTTTLVRPSYAITNLAFGPFGSDVRLSPRIAPQLVGQGLLEAIDDAAILVREDPDDADGDGISGRARWDTDGPTPRVGRFGWKAAHASVEGQAADAFSEDLGITSSRAPKANCPAPQTACAAAPNGGTPELDASRLTAAAAYLRLLGVPPRRGGDARDVLQGKALFHGAGCAACHRPSFQTAASTLEPELASQTIWPYSDLLLHDLGEGLSDHRTEGAAGEREWRTPTLWGLGLVPIVNGARHLLHDGRARSVEEAILWHDGEAKASRVAFEKLAPDARARLVAFVESL